MTVANTRFYDRSADRDSWPDRRYAWYVVCMLMLAYAVSIVDRTGLSLLVQPIESDLHISDSAIGLLQGAAFAIFYATLGLPAGFLADRMNRGRLIALGIIVWSLSTIACGTATGFAGLFAARLCVGAGEATLNPAGLSIISDLFPAESRSKAIGIFAMGTAIGVAASLFLGGASIELVEKLQVVGPRWLLGIPPWKLVFLFLGAPGILLGLVFALTVREPSRRGLTSRNRRVSLRPLISTIAGTRFIFLGLIAWSALNSIAIYALLGWFPTVMIRVHGWTAAETGELLGIYGVPCSIFSCISAGWSIAWLERSGRTEAPIIVAVGASLWVTIAGVLANLASSANQALFWYCVLSLASNTAGIGVLTYINRMTPNELRGQVVALLGTASGLISLSVGPAAVGFLSDNVFGRRGIALSVTTVLAVSGTAGIGLLFAVFRRAQLGVRIA